MNNQTAKFWKYDGNHPNGSNHDRYDPHGFGLDVIAYTAYVGDGGDYQNPLDYESAKLIKTKHHKGDSFGHEVTVSAPAEVWEKAKKAHKNMLQHYA
ncbi:MAG: hypothetical protein KatS3mg087_0596 [Patescibacteria group bacterium]|nr:MAG: hypothetical protein KatS3mg087_0596 [Patescibacteria group bacterium]